MRGDTGQGGCGVAYRIPQSFCFHHPPSHPRADRQNSMDNISLTHNRQAVAYHCEERDQAQDVSHVVHCKGEQALACIS